MVVLMLTNIVANLGTFITRYSCQLRKRSTERLEMTYQSWLLEQSWVFWQECAGRRERVSLS